MSLLYFPEVHRRIIQRHKGLGLLPSRPPSVPRPDDDEPVYLVSPGVGTHVRLENKDEDSSRLCEQQ